MTGHRWPAGQAGADPWRSLESTEDGRRRSRARGWPRLAKVSIVIPALNEEKAVKSVIGALPTAELRAAGYEVEVLVVDNGSEDRTAELAREAGAEVVSEPRRGYGRAYKTGFDHATGDIIVTCDADMTYPTEDIPGLVALLEEENLDFVTTDRLAMLENGAMSRRNRLGNRVLTLATSILFGIRLADSQSGMWVFRRRLLDRLVLRSDQMPFSEELKIEACRCDGCRWTEVPIRYRHRIGDPKLRHWTDGLLNLGYLMRKRILR